MVEYTLDQVVENALCVDVTDYQVIQNMYAWNSYNYRKSYSNFTLDSVTGSWVHSDQVVEWMLGQM